MYHFLYTLVYDAIRRLRGKDCIIGDLSEKDFEESALIYRDDDYIILNSTITHKEKDVSCELRLEHLYLEALHDKYHFCDY